MGREQNSIQLARSGIVMDQPLVLLPLDSLYEFQCRHALSHYDPLLTGWERLGL